jgi:putative flippase GtrA
MMMKNKIQSQLIKFGLVGFLNTAVDYGVFALLTMVFRLDSIISHVFSYSCGVINSYYFNRIWTFQRKDRVYSAEFLRFIIVNLISLGTSTLVLNSLETQAGLSSYLAKIGAVICSMAINFAGSKFVVFRD